MEQINLHLQKYHYLAPKELIMMNARLPGSVFYPIRGPFYELIHFYL